MIIRKIQRLIRCVAWFVRNIRTINQMFKLKDSEKNFRWFVQNMNVIDRVVKSLNGEVK